MNKQKEYEVENEMEHEYHRNLPSQSWREQDLIRDLHKTIKIFYKDDLVE